MSVRRQSAWPTKGVLSTETSIWLMSLGTGTAQQLVPWQAGVFIRATSFSADGSELAFSRESEGVNQVIVTPLTSGSLPTVFRGVIGAVFSPLTPGEMALVRVHSGEVGSDAVPLRDIEIQAATGDHRQLTHGGGVQGEPPAWSPAGDKIAYVASTVDSGSRGTSELFITGAAGDCSLEIGIAARFGRGRLFGPAWAGSEEEPAFDRCE
jgi:hypothetical protein